jgi:hypothetical protein
MSKRNASAVIDTNIGSLAALAGLAFLDDMTSYSLIRLALAAARLVRPLASRSPPPSPAARLRSVGSLRRVGGPGVLSPAFARQEQRLPLLRA